jgi:hypothetical protein
VEEEAMVVGLALAVVAVAVADGTTDGRLSQN